MQAQTKLRNLFPTLTTGAVLALAIGLLRGQGRFWSCLCGQIFVWVSDAWGPQTSQHLFDPYSFTHILHGVALGWLVMLAASRWAWKWQLWGVITLEAAWEVFENSRFVIERYRAATAALGYTGDTIINSVGDITACVLGFLLARKIGWRLSIVFFVAVEIVLLLWVRDSLLLNIVMLIYPIDSIKAWQTGH